MSRPSESRMTTPEDPYRPGLKEDFDRLYRSTYCRIFATLMLILRNPAAAEDATQEAYMRGFRAWSDWKQDAPAEAWMYRIALNVAFTHTGGGDRAAPPSRVHESRDRSGVECA